MGSLFDYFGKKVRITIENQKTFEGVVSCVQTELDTDSGEQELNLDATNGTCYGFTKSEIKNIEIITVFTKGKK